MRVFLVPWVRRAALAVLIGAISGGPSPAQAPIRRATNVSALLTYPTFFHGQQVIVRGELAESGPSLLIDGPDDKPPLHLILKDRKGSVGAGQTVEIRGQFWDVGRLGPDDPRLRPTLDALGGIVEPDSEGRERRPRPGEVLILIADRIETAGPPSAPTVRTIALDPGRYKDQHVTVSGQFRGRNLYGDLPQAPGVSKWDFVIRSADAAIWVTSVRPKGKGFDLNVEARVDTGHWVEVSGVVKADRGLTWIEASQIAASKPVTETVDEPVTPAAAPPLAAPEVIFSAPTEGEVDVELTTAVRVQFSRDINPASVKNQVRVSYLGAESTERGEPQTPPIEFTTAYQGGNRVLEIRFARPLERFRTLKVELLAGITATDGATLTPWTLTFSIGG